MAALNTSVERLLAFWLISPYSICKFFQQIEISIVPNGGFSEMAQLQQPWTDDVACSLYEILAGIVHNYIVSAKRQLVSCFKSQFIPKHYAL